MEIQPKPKRKTRSSEFKKGCSPGSGRPKGRKNKSSLLREAIIHDAESIILKNFTKIVKKTVEMAENGDTTCMKIIWDRYMPAKSFDKSDPDKLNISITIEGIKTASITEGEFKEVN